MRINQRTAVCIPIMFFVLICISACATVPELRVEYRIPSKVNTFKGEAVFLSFEDMRDDKEILGNGAKKDFEGFSGHIALSLAHGTDKGFRVGLYELEPLFLEIFKLRMESLGMNIVSERKSAASEVVIALKALSLDLKKRKWVAKMNYEARLVKNNQVLNKLMINGQSDRAKIVGRAQADKVMGDLFTDLVNTLDVVKLFQ